MSLSLPSAYSPIHIDVVDSVLHEALRRARAGAPEGTLVWADRQRAARTRRGYAWEAPPGNLHCALVLEPEMPLTKAREIALVGASAAGSALAEVVTPMTQLGYGWPGDLLLNRLLAGQLDLHADVTAQGTCPRLVLGLSLNVAWHPPNPEPERFNSVHASGDGECDGIIARDLLELFARHLLRGLTRWQDQGFEPLREAWLTRADPLVEAPRLEDVFPSRDGARYTLEEDASLRREVPGGQVERFTLSDYYRHTVTPAPDRCGG